MLQFSELERYFASLKKKIEEDGKNLTILKSLKKELLSRESIVGRSIKELNNIDNVELRRKYGQFINQNKNLTLNLLSKKIELLEKSQTKGKFFDDVVLEIDGKDTGSPHPITKMINKMLIYHIERDFTPHIANEVVKSEDNFDFLNFPKSHVARLEANTFYLENLDNHYILNTHTTSFQRQVLHENATLPIRAVNYGKAYRNDETDSTHLPFFHQFDCVYVDSDANVTSLKKHILNLASTIFSKRDLKYRFRRTYFPFTEPSFEIDIECTHSSSKEFCTLCNNEGWIEWCGLGMINQNVFKNADLSNCRGYAFGIGIERTVMLLEEIKDIRKLILQ